MLAAGCVLGAAWLIGRVHALATETLTQEIGGLTHPERSVVYSKFRDVIDSLHE